MTCKCGARTYKGHLRLVRKGRAASHVYKGAIGDLREKDQ